MFASSTFTAPPIAPLTRAAAHRVALLLDVSSSALTAGMLAPTSITAAAAVAVGPDHRKLLTVLRSVWAAAQHTDEAEIKIPAAVIGLTGWFVAEVSNGDHGEPVITISRPE